MSQPTPTTNSTPVPDTLTLTQHTITRPPPLEFNLPSIGTHDQLRKSVINLLSVSSDRVPPKKAMTFRYSRRPIEPIVSDLNKSQSREFLPPSSQKRNANTPISISSECSLSGQKRKSIDADITDGFDWVDQWDHQSIKDEIMAMHCKNLKLKNRNKSLEKETNNLTQTNNELLRKIKQLNKRIEESEDENVSQSIDNQVFRNNNEKLKKETTKKQNKIDELEEKLLAKENHIQMLEKLVSSWELDQDEYFFYNSVVERQHQYNEEQVKWSKEFFRQLSKANQKIILTLDDDEKLEEHIDDMTKDEIADLAYFHAIENKHNSWKAAQNWERKTKYKKLCIEHELPNESDSSEEEKEEKNKVLSQKCPEEDLNLIELERLVKEQIEKEKKQ